MHRIIGVFPFLAVGTRTAVEDGQSVAGGVGAAEVPSVSAATVHEDGYEAPVGDGRDVVLLGVIAREQAGFHVGHYPGTFAVAAAPGGGSAVIGGLHRPGAHGASVGRGIAVIEAAAAVVMVPVDDIVHPLRLVVDGQAAGVVAAVSHARHDIGAIDLLPAEEGGGHVGDGTGVETALVRPLEGARRRRQQVVAHPGLVVDHRNVAHGPFAEGVLRRGVGDAVLPGVDVQRRSVAFADHLIQRPPVLGIEQARGAMGRHARGAAFLVDVAGTFTEPGQAFAGDGRPEEHEASGRQEEYPFHNEHFQRAV